MLELPLVKGDPFHHVMEAILDLSDVAHVVCTTRGLNLLAVDTKHLAIVSLLFPAEDFKGYTCDEYISIGIPIRDLVNAIRCGDDKDTITLKVGEENFGTITLSFVSPEKNTVDYEFRLVDAKLERFRLPDRHFLRSKYQGSVKMPSVEFRRICKCLSNFGDEYGVISVTDEDLTYFAKGTDGDVYVEYKQQEEDTTIFKIDVREPVRLAFNPKYLNTFAKVFTLSGQVKLFLSKTHPLMVECKIGQKGRIRCFVAPKVEPEFQGEEEKKEAQKEEVINVSKMESDTDANKNKKRKRKLTDD
ncbi:proliferating cell nuclear antigen-like [Triticum dicoccoides]|uniref:proliferating cell nuclear antigen-like n=1 Tax=Triticum dicoccoides TaxID=85692 RepID=UPI00188F0842|nr:proliferating cell nuclear antigen-like [Triticum dicoccoides]